MSVIYGHCRIAAGCPSGACPGASGGSCLRFLLLWPDRSTSICI